MDEDKFLKCIVDPSRRSILRAIGHEEMCVSDIIAATGLEQTLVSFHLKTLRDCGMVACRRDGKNNLYRVTDDCILDIFNVIKSITRSINERGNNIDDCKGICDC